MDLLLLAGSLAGVLFLAAVAWALGLGGGGLASAGEAIEEAEAAMAGFRGTEAFVAADSRAALVRGEAGDWVLLKRHGSFFAARRLRSPVPHAWKGDTLVIPTGERRFGDVALPLGAEERDRLASLL